MTEQKRGAHTECYGYVWIRKEKKKRKKNSNENKIGGVAHCQLPYSWAQRENRETAAGYAMHVFRIQYSKRHIDT